jgi:hypothetical protein
MCKGKCPETKVRSSIGNSTKDEFNGLNHLMNECFSEGMSMLFDAHIFDLVFKLFHLIMSLSHSIIGSTVTFSFRSVDISIVIIDVGEFNSFMIFLGSWITSEAAWFDKEHNWDQNDNNDKKCNSNGTLSWNIISNICAIIWGLRFTEGENCINHNIDNRWGVLILAVTY